MLFNHLHTAMFNSVVTETLDNSNQLHDQIIKASTATVANMTRTNSSVAFTVTVSDSINIFEIGGLIFFVVMGAAGGTGVLLVIILVLCIIVGCLVFGTERSLPYTTTAAVTVQVQLQPQGTSVYA